MPAIVDYVYDDKIIDNIEAWNYGTNWPCVYVYYNGSSAYVGETLDAVRRTEQHKQEPQFAQFTNMLLISGKSFNKSVILDLESFLIKYMSAEGSKKLINGNAGVTNHNYFYKEAYEDDFKEIWRNLIDRGIVRKTLSDIENSELFKFSPYKALNDEQYKAAYLILEHIYHMNNASKESLVQVTGGAGTGKTILAVYLVKLLVDIFKQKPVWHAIDDAKFADTVECISKKINGIKEIGFVVPMIELRNTMKQIFNSIEGLSAGMIYAPEDVIKKHFDILVVDEAHRLYQNKHLPQGATGKFKRVNMELMKSDYKNDSSDLTELDWIIRSSRMQILFYDSRQSIRTPDIDKERFQQICKPHLFKYVELYSQMRCKGGNGYYDYIKQVLFDANLSTKDYKKIENYDLRAVDSIEELVDMIEKRNKEGGLNKLVTGPGWSMNEDIVIDDKVFHWAGTGGENSTIYSIHKTQGFDLNYAGVILGREVYYNPDTCRIEINKKNLKDNHTKSSGDEKMREYILDIYLTLLTRGIHGTYIYAMDYNLREYLHRLL